MFCQNRLQALLLLQVVYALSSSVPSWKLIVADDPTVDLPRFVANGTLAAHPGRVRSADMWLKVDTDDVYLFGGRYVDGSLSNTMWLFHWSNRSWTWLGGNQQSDSDGVPLQWPPAAAGRNKWIDGNGEVWFYGGLEKDSTGGDSASNSLWKWNGTWEHVNADVYAPVVRTSDLGPGGRFSHSMFQVAGKFGLAYLKGGYGWPKGSANVGQLEDLWTFDFNKRTWAFVSGGKSINNPPIYPPLNGTHTSTSKPGARRAFRCATFTDRTFCLGGFGFNQTQSPQGNKKGQFSDVWEYDALIDRWIWHTDAANRGFVDQPSLMGPSRVSPGGIIIKAGASQALPGLNGVYLHEFPNMWLFDIDKLQWSLTAAGPSNPGTRSLMSILSLADGSTLAYGGINKTGGLMTDMYQFFPATIRNVSAGQLSDSSIGVSIDGTVGIGQNVLIQGGVVLGPSSNLTFSSGTIVNATGDVVIDGAVIVELDSLPVDGQVITLFVAPSFSSSSSFDSIQISSPALSSCQTATGTAVPSDSSFSVLVSVDSTRCGLPLGAIIGIAVGAVLLAVIIIVLLAVLVRRRRDQWTTRKAEELKRNDLAELKRSRGGN